MAKTIDEIQQEIKANGLLMREFALDRSAVDEDSRTIKLAFASDKPVDHWFGRLQLSMDKKAIRTARLENGAPLLADHDHRDHIGVVESYEIGTDGMARATVRFSRSARGEEVYQDVLDGIKRNVSVGFMVHEMHREKTEKGQPDLYRSDDWEPIEISIVAAPADISVGVGRGFRLTDDTPVLNNPEAREIPSTTETTMETTIETPATPAVETQRSAALAAAQEIREWGEVLGEQDAAREFLRTVESPTVDAFKAMLRAKQAASAIVPPPPAIETAARQGGVEFARTIPRHGAIRSFQGENAAEKAYRFGKWLLGGPLGRANAAAWCNEHGITLKRDQSESVNEAGGYLVPEEFGNDLIDLREQYGVFRRNTKIVPMSSDTHSDPRRTGGLTAVFEGEADTGAVSTLGWDRVGLVAKKLMVLARYSSEISEDSLISMADTLASEMAYAFANKEDECGFNGDGTSTYGGIVGVREKLLGLSSTRANIAGLVVGSGNLYSELALVDFEAVVAKLPEYADTPMAKWFVSRSFYYNVMVKVALAAGGNAATDIEATRAKRFLGYDVEFAQVMPKVEANDQVCALLGDLSKGARMGTRRDTTISLSEHVLHSTDQIQVRGTERFDINVHDVGNESGTAASRVPGPIVGLLTAAS